MSTSAPPNRTTEHSSVSALDAGRLRSLVDEAPEAVAILDESLRYVYVNVAFERLINLPGADLIGREVAEMTPGLRGSAFEKELRRVVSNGQATRLEYHAGLGRAFDIHAVPFGAGMAFFAREVTDLRRANEDLRQKEEHFRAILNTEPGIVMLLDRDGLVLDTNPAGLALLQVDGYEDLIGRAIAPFIAPSDRHLLAAVTQRVFDGGEATVVLEIVGCRGSRRRVEHRSVPLRDASGRIIAALSITSDMTERFEAEAALRKRAMQHAALASLGAMALRDPDVEVLTDRAVQSVSETLRVPAPAALELLRRHGLAEVVRLRGPEETSGGIRLEPEDVDFLRSAAHLVSSAVERRRAEDVLHEREEQLRQAQKMEAIGQLAGGVAHDFNNLLTVINVHTDLLLVQLQEGDAMKEDVEEIARAATRAASLTRQLLTFSRKQVVQPQVLDLARVVSGIEPMLRRLIGEDVEFATHAQQVEQVLADEGEIEQVLINLVVNARDAMPQGGRLRVDVRNAVVDETLCEQHPSLRPGEYVQLVVSDSGMGMTSETMMRAFEPFFTTKEPGRGTGLGLSTVYGIVKQSGGAITVDSSPGNGTTFTVYLPVVRDSLARPAGVIERRVASVAGETVLLVEDEDIVRRLAKRVLESQGYTVLEAINGDDALRLANDYAGVIDLLLSDVVMPDVGGRVLAERLTASRPDIEVMFMSGYTDDDILRRGLLERGQRLLQKPFTAATLAHEVRSVLDAKKRRRAAANTALPDE